MVSRTWFFPICTFILLSERPHKEPLCDRLFNLVKQTYHKKNIYTYDELDEEISRSNYVTNFRMRSEHFKDHTSWQDKFYRTPTGGEFKQTHVFTIYKNCPTVLCKQDYSDSPVRVDDLRPTGQSRKANSRLTSAERKLQLQRMEEDLEILNAPGLQ